MNDKKLTQVAVRLKAGDAATPIFFEERKRFAERPGRLSDNKLIHMFIEAYPRIAELEQQRQDLESQLQSEIARCKELEAENVEIDKKLRQSLEDRVKDLEAQRELNGKIKQLELQLAQK
ncbi:MAG: hypothetical protein ACE5OZ_01270 [Candidatus Heimdallarchaeota archaeon]